MAVLGPFVQRIPEFILRTNDQELIKFYEYDNLWKEQVWRALSQPSGDVSDLDQKSESSLTETSQLIQRLFTLSQQVNDGFLYYLISTNHTTSGNEFIRANDTLTITLNLAPAHLEKAVIQPIVDKIITVSGSINGLSEVKIHKSYDMLAFTYNEYISEWVVG